MYENLCQTVGNERIKMINELKKHEVDDICVMVEKCYNCPLALHYNDVFGVSKICCFRIVTKTQMRKILENGGYFRQLKRIEKNE